MSHRTASFRIGKITHVVLGVDTIRAVCQCGAGFVMIRVQRCLPLLDRWNKAHRQVETWMTALLWISRRRCSLNWTGWIDRGRGVGAAPGQSRQPDAPMQQELPGKYAQHAHDQQEDQKGRIHLESRVAARRRCVMLFGGAVKIGVGTSDSRRPAQIVLFFGPLRKVIG